MGLRHAIGSLRQAPGFALAAIVALALGIGANVAIFSVTDALVMKSVAVPNADGMVMAMRHARGSANHVHLSPAAFLAWRERARSFASASAFTWRSPTLTNGGGAPLSLLAADVAAKFFSTLGAQPLLGRTFAADENTPGKDAVAILSYGLWRRRFAADPKVVGATIHLDGRAYSIVGVMPRAFDFPLAAQLWMPLALTPAETADRTENDFDLQMVARLAPGVSASVATAELETFTQIAARKFPTTDRGLDALVIPLRRYITGDLNYQYSMFLWIATFFVLLIACANVANLQFARATGRSREAAIRSALGASRWRLVGERLTESLVLALVGAAASLLLAQWGLQLILDHMPAEIARFVAGWYQIRLDGSALLYTLGVAIAAGIVAGILPALLASHPDLNTELKAGGRGGSPSRAHHRSRNALLVVEIALALVLLAGAGLTGRGVNALFAANHGFSPDGVLTAQIFLPPRTYPGPGQQREFYRQVLSRIEAAPGVAAAAVASNVPFGGSDSVVKFQIAGRPPLVAGQRQFTEWQDVSDGYFAAMRVPLVAGRQFDARDGADAPPVAIVSREFAQNYFPGPDPMHAALGQRVQLVYNGGNQPWATIVGVAGDVRYNWLQGFVLPTIYRPYSQSPDSAAFFLLRTRRGDPLSLLPELRRQVAAVDAGLALSQTLTLSKVISESVLGLSYVAVLMAVLGGVALALAAVGIFGVMAYIVGERTREIGLRMALGAQRGSILRMIVRRGLAVTAIGLGIGLVLALALARALASWIIGVSSLDPVTFAAVLLVLLAAALLACYWPARRAARLDPMVALREE